MSGVTTLLTPLLLKGNERCYYSLFNTALTKRLMSGVTTLLNTALLKRLLSGVTTLLTPLLLRGY